MTFAGFPPAGLMLLARLPTLDKAGFATEHQAWEQHLLQPARAFGEDLGALLADHVSPGLVADPRSRPSTATCGSTPVGRRTRTTCCSAGGRVR